MLYYLVVVAYLALEQFQPIIISEFPISQSECEHARDDQNANDARLQEDRMKELGAQYACMALPKKK